MAPSFGTPFLVGRAQIRLEGTGHGNFGDSGNHQRLRRFLLESWYFSGIPPFAERNMFFCFHCFPLVFNIIHHCICFIFSSWGLKQMEELEAFDTSSKLLKGKIRGGSAARSFFPFRRTCLPRCPRAPSACSTPTGPGSCRGPGPERARSGPMQQGFNG